MIRIKKAIRFIPAILLLLVSGTLSGQDILSLKSGRVIKATIVEESQSEIKYREYGIDDSPLYTIDRAKVESVKYGRKPGQQRDQGDDSHKQKEIADNAGKQGDQSLTISKRYVMQDGKMLSTRQVKTIMEDFPEAVDIYSKGKRQLNASNACAGGVVVACAIAGLSSSGMEDSERKKYAATGLGISAGLIVAGIVLASNGRKNVRKAVNIYNTGNLKPTSLRIDMAISPAGVGIAMRF